MYSSTSWWYDGRWWIERNRIHLLRHYVCRLRYVTSISMHNARSHSHCGSVVRAPTHGWYGRVDCVDLLMFSLPFFFFSSFSYSSTSFSFSSALLHDVFGDYIFSIWTKEPFKRLMFLYSVYIWVFGWTMYLHSTIPWKIWCSRVNEWVVRMTVRIEWQ